MEHILSVSSIRERKADLNRVILDAQAQLQDLEVAERIVRRFGHTTEDRPASSEMDDLVAGVTPSQPSNGKSQIVTGLLSSRSLFLSILRQSEILWMTANEIQERASSIKGREVPMATVSPTLSNLKNAGLIVREGLKVALADRLNENEAPDDNAAGASDTALAAH